MPTVYRKLRCSGCGKLLAEIAINSGPIVIVCPRCNRRETGP